MKDKTKAFLAGLLDSEGDVSIGRHISTERTYIVKGKEYTYSGYTSYGVGFAVYNTYLPLMKYLVSCFGGTYRVLSKETKTRQTVYAWKPEDGKHTLSVLDLVCPYIALKNSQANICREFLQIGSTNPEKRKALYEQCLAANSSSVTTDTNQVFKWKKNIQNAYFSAIFDGEGTAAVYKSPTIWITNSNKSLLESVKVLYNANDVSGGYRKNAKPNRLPEYRISIPVANMEKFILRILPYSVIKRDQLLLTLEALRGVTKERKEEIQNKLFELKHPLKAKIQSGLVGDYKSVFTEM